MPAPRRTRNARLELEDIDEVFQSLAHASRRHILLVLKHRGGAMTAGEIADRFSCSWPTTTRHLQKLERSGLVAVEQHGRERVYRLGENHLRKVVSTWLRSFA